MNRHVRTLAPSPSVPGSLPAVVVLLGDLLVLLAFVAVGVYSHGGYPWTLPVYTLETLAPFLVAWLPLAAVAGLYGRETLTDYRRTVALVVVVWIAVSLVGGAIRATSLFHGGAPPDFIAVNILFGTLFLLPWRLATVWLRRRYG